MRCSSSYYLLIINSQILVLQIIKFSIVRIFHVGFEFNAMKLDGFTNSNNIINRSTELLLLHMIDNSLPRITIFMNFDPRNAMQEINHEDYIDRQ